MRDSPPAFAYRGDCPFGTGDMVPAVPAGTGETCTAGPGGSVPRGQSVRYTAGVYRTDYPLGTPKADRRTVPVSGKLTEEPSPCQSNWEV